MPRIDETVLVRRNIGRINTRALPVARATGGPVPERPPLPTSAVEYWHSEYQCTPTTWTGQIGARVLQSQGATAPLVETDPGYFNGRAVGKTVAASSSRWRNTTAFTALMPAGSFVYVFAVYRLYGNPGNAIAVCYTNGMGGGATHYIGASTTRALSQMQSTMVNGQNETGSAVHFSEAWLDGTNHNLQGEQNALFQTPLAAGLSVPVTMITVGATPTGSGLYTGSYAFFLICSANPTVAERDALKAYARSYWGIA